MDRLCANIEPSAASSIPCDTYSCIAVARAVLSDVISAAFDHNASAFPTLFKKYWQRAFAQPGTSSDPNAASNSGHYTLIIAEVGEFPTVLFDSSIHYTTLVGEGSDPSTGDRDPWLFYVRDPIWPDWADAEVVNRRVQLLQTASD
jgi:hypothetical protein